MSNEDKPTDKPWQEIALEASRETDPEKLMEVIEELCGALDKKRNKD